MALPRPLPRLPYPACADDGVRFLSSSTLELCALRWFRVGVDTAEVAAVLGYPEARVANALARARDWAVTPSHRVAS